VNYKLAVKAFNDYWKNKEKPAEEEEIFAAKAKKIKSDPKGPETQMYAFEYKRFLNWQRSVLPFVQPDGRILTKAERLKIFEEEKKRRQEAGL
jgi:hypothetical protein